jgi:hypothetical protein
MAPHITLRENISTIMPKRLRARLLSEARRSLGDIAVGRASPNLVKGSLLRTCSIVSLDFRSEYVGTENLIALRSRVPVGSSSQAIHGLTLTNPLVWDPAAFGDSMTGLRKPCPRSASPSEIKFPLRVEKTVSVSIVSAHRLCRTNMRRQKAGP